MNMAWNIFVFSSTFIVSAVVSWSPPKKACPQYSLLSPLLVLSPNHSLDLLNLDPAVGDYPYIEVSSNSPQMRSHPEAHYLQEKTDLFVVDGCLVFDSHGCELLGSWLCFICSLRLEEYLLLSASFLELQDGHGKYTAHLLDRINHYYLS